MAKNFIKTYVIYLSSLVAVFSFAGSVYAFVEPTAPPPGNNVPAPLHVGAQGQSKSGGLFLNTGGASTGLAVYGAVGIGTPNPSTPLELYAGGSGGNGMRLTTGAQGGCTPFVSWVNGPTNADRSSIRRCGDELTIGNGDSESHSAALAVKTNGNVIVQSLCLGGVCHASWPESAQVQTYWADSGSGNIKNTNAGKVVVGQEFGGARLQVSAFDTTTALPTFRISSSDPNYYDMFLPYMQQNWYNPIVQTGDSGIIYKSNGFVIAPNANAPANGLRMDVNGNVAVGSLATGVFTTVMLNSIQTNLLGQTNILGPTNFIGKITSTVKINPPDGGHNEISLDVNGSAHMVSLFLDYSAKIPMADISNWADQSLDSDNGFTKMGSIKMAWMKRGGGSGGGSNRGRVGFPGYFKHVFSVQCSVRSGVWDASCAFKADNSAITEYYVNKDYDGVDFLVIGE